MTGEKTAKPGPWQAPAALAGFVALWAAAAAATADPDVLPGPLAVLAIAVDEARSGALWTHVGATLARVAVAFALAMVLGSALGILLGRRPGLNRFAEPVVVILLNVPALVVIVLCYLWIGLSEAAAIVAVSVNKLAMVTVTLREGARTLERPVADMAQVFGMSRMARLRHVVLPQLAPYLLASARNGLAIIWKIVLVAEFLGRGSGVGFQIHLYFQLFDTGHVLAYALSFVAVMLAIEYLLLKPWERGSGDWRRSAVT